MLPAERRQFILDELYKTKAVTVHDLAQELEVTPMTIRRDLQLLEDGGLIEKSHGGAVLTESLVKEATYRNRKLVHNEEKQRIATMALPLIDSSMSVYLDAGTTNYELAVLMSKQHWDNLTIVTNDLAIAQTVTVITGADVIMLGGHIDIESNSSCGGFATHMVQQMHFDLCFLGTQAVAPDWRIMTANAEKIDLKRACLQAADTVVLLADHSKFKKHKLYYILDVADFDVLITDYNATEEEQEQLQEQHVQYIHA
jgi:DeoR/GlpR family transcriptional regulator of sugar metabolism